MNIIEAAKAAGGTVTQPYDYGAKPDRMIMSFESLERLAQIIRSQALEDAAIKCDDAAGRLLDRKRVPQVDAHVADVLLDKANAIRALKGANE